MISTTALSSRKRSRPASLPLEPWCSLGLLVVFLLVSTVSSTLDNLPAANIASISFSLYHTKSYRDTSIDDWGYDFDEEYYEDDEWDEDDDERDYKEEILHDNWTLEELAQMDRLYKRYIKEITKTHGEDWEEEWEVPVSKQELYKEYLQYKGQKQHEALEWSDRI